MKRLAFVLALILPVSGCAWIKGLLSRDESVEPPSPLVTFTPKLTVRALWTSRVGKGSDKQFVRLSPGVDRGRVFAADIRGRLAAVDAEAGKTLWELNTRAPVSAGVGLADGLVLLGTSHAEVLAFGEENGAAAWRSGVSSEILAVPRGADGVVVAQTIDGKVFGLDERGGRRLWMYQSVVPVLTLRSRGAPLIARGAAVVGLPNGKLVALTLHDGKVGWESPIAIPHGRSELERMVDISADPVLYESTIYVASFQGRVAAVDLESGRVLWGRDLSSYAGIAVDGRNVYVTDDVGQVWALDRFSGTSVWKQDKLRGRSVTGPVLFGSSVVVGDFEGYLHWLDTDNGAFQARHRVDSAGLLTPGVVAGDTLYVSGERGVLTALRVEKESP
jgi:outer membrane protein assembly factor BamB